MINNLFCLLRKMLRDNPILFLVLSNLIAIWGLVIPLRGVLQESRTPDLMLVYSIASFLVLSVALFLIMLAILSKFNVRNLLLDSLIALLLSIILGQFLTNNSPLVLNGTNIRDQMNLVFYFKDIIVFSFFFFLFFFLRKFPSNKFKSRLLLGVSLWSLSMLIYSLTYYTTSVYNQSRESSRNVSYTEFNYGTGEDTLFIILDSFQSSYFNQIRLQYKKETEFLEGFTYFPDTTAAYPTTRGSSTNYSTGVFNLNSQRTETHIKSQKHIIDVFKEGKFKLDLSVSPISGREYNFDLRDINNAKKATSPTTLISFLQSIMSQLEISFFKLAPNVLKPELYNEGKWIVEAKLKKALPLVTSNYDQIFLSEFVKRAKLANSKEKIFHFYHLFGAHHPLQTVEEFPGSMYVSSGDPYLDNSRVALYKLKIILEKLKSLMAYDALRIVVISDHGYGRFDQSQSLSNLDPIILNVTSSANALLLLKPRKSSGFLKESNLQMELSDIPCLLSEGAINLDCKQVQDEVWKSGRGGVVRRFFYYEWSNDAWGNSFLPPLREFYVVGNSTNPQNWRYVASPESDRSYQNLEFFPINKSIGFGDLNAEKFMVLKGFSTPEKSHRWSLGSMSSIGIKVRPELAKKGIKIELGVRPLTDSLQSNKIEVFINNVYIQTMNLDSLRNQYQLNIPEKFLRDGNVVLTLETPGSISPELLGQSQDSRLLARAFSSMYLSTEGGNQ